MRRMLSLGLLFLFVAITAIAVAGGEDRSAEDRGGKESVRERFVGGWRLAWLEQPGADGKIHRTDCCGMLVYTRDGHMSVQVMEREPPGQAAAGPEQYSQGGYEASYGSYEVDEGAHTFTFHVEGALVRTLIGKDLPRAYEFSGKQLIVRSTHLEEHWKVAWERY